jgi:hypothetical protein
MTWDDWICLVLIIVGIIMFLYGANYYNEIAGWLGILLFVSATAAFVMLYVYKSLTRSKISIQT